MTRIYLDNAATSWPKPSEVYDAVDRYQRHGGAPAGRGTYREAADIERVVLAARRSIGRLIGVQEPRRIVFTCNGTDSLNLALHGLLRPGDHVITSVADHNSTLRPLRFLESQRQIRVSRISCDANGVVDIDAMRQAITPATRLIALVHASNVTGVIQPVTAVARMAREHGIYFLLDAAQSLGHLDTQVSDISADLIAAPGHKGLLGPLGTGVLYLGPGIEKELKPSRQGGTGTSSERDEQPESLPDRYESGNHNVPGIVGLEAGVGFVLQHGIGSLRQHELELTQRLLDGLFAISGVTVYGPRDATQRVGVVSFQVSGYDPQEVAAHLDASNSIQVRAGLHCAPLMHASLGTLEQGGTVRMSPGPFTTMNEIDSAIQAVAEMACYSAE